MKKAEGGEEEEEQEEASMHDQTSVAHWSATLAFADLGAVAKEEDWRKSGGRRLIQN